MKKIGNFLFGNLQEVSFKANFIVRCVDSSGTTTLSKGKRYTVSQLGFNGYYKVKGDTNRYVWHKPDRFREIIKK